MQYTIRNIPAELDLALRTRASREDKSLNQVAVEGLMRAFGFGELKAPQRDLSFLVGSWDFDPEVERALEDQRQIDPELWA